ncbi:MAG: bifunctional DNA-formamidopyrimidine glycosylase/DNA-(apurinic or apyrimidinic site) lyase [Bdellovibrionales bacterium]|nr:bifunctional DNA-formamidopyrimidine glycosylase/DNA-(apurinic or apyrimidinic site) lyase [Bdellovibrionales bacterium]MCB0408540.1 bifunctional DNA-formamidopyrimidine glycosylase/DNA-(apurinic or apyrimidinic site) lyase [Bdellovibrionales bacterium]
MPELPEVETVRRGLNDILPKPVTIVKVKLGHKGLRYPFRRSAILKSCGQKILGVERRAKYLLFRLEKAYLLSHLGMTGSWRLGDGNSDPHDHVVLTLSDGRQLIYRDPRRFGQFDYISELNFDGDPRFSHLGPDPLEEDAFSYPYFKEKLKGRSSSIKSLIMNQGIVVGVGNIYASESLYLAGIHPLRSGSHLQNSEIKILREAIAHTLWDAIACGGTTISDFRQAGGSSGYFQNLLFVYGRAGEPCPLCNTTIESQVIVGRNSFWCPQCQPLS